METSNNNNTSTDPFAPRLTPTLAPPPTSHTARSVSITMEDYITDGKDDQELDLNMVHDFGGAEGLGVDMRDFTNHDQDEDHDHKDSILDSSIATPAISNSVEQVTPQPPTSAGASALGGDIPPNVDDMFQTETGLEGDDEDDDDGDMTEGPTGKRQRGEAGPSGFTYVEKDGEPSRRKIKIEYINDKSRRHITFSKRKAGIMKKAYELSILTGTQVLLLVVSETGLVYTFTTTKLQPLVQKPEGKNLIQACLNAPDGFGPDGQPLGGPVAPTKAKNGGLAIRPHKLTAAASAAMAASAQAASDEHASHNQAQPQGQAQTHAQAQADAAASIGQGTPVSARPKKRLPSKKRQASSSQSQQPVLPELDIPPVPQIPDIHRQASPNTQGHPSSGGIIDPSLHSPLSAGFHMPPEYQNQQGGPPGQGGLSPNPHHQYYQPPHPPPQQQGPEGYPYYAPPPQHPHQQHQHPGYMNMHHHQMFQQQPHLRG